MIKIDLVLFDIPKCEKILNGLVLELQDCSFDLLQSIKISTTSKDAFIEADVVIFLGGFPRK